MTTNRQEIITQPVYSLAPTNFEEAERLATMVASSGICPSSLRGRPADVMIILQMGVELKLGPMQALRTLGCINGMPFAYGDGLLALCKRHSEFEDIKEWIEGEISSENATAFCRMTRKGKEPQTRSFSIQDAKRAGLWKKSGPWTQYPQRMLQHRARGYCARDVFPDALFGLMSEDEVRNIPSQKSASVPTGKGLAALKETLVSKPENDPEIIEGSFELVNNDIDEGNLIDELMALMLEKKISQKFQDKLRAQFKVNEIHEIPLESIQKIISYIKESF